MKVAAVSARRREPLVRSKGRGGFTLMELLLVVAMIGILTSMLMPVLAKAKSRAQAVRCLNNLRQWGLSLQLYTAENEDRIPRDGLDDQGLYAVDTTMVDGPGSPRDPVAWFNALPSGVGEKPFSNYWTRTQRPRERFPFPGGLAPMWHCPAARATREDTFLRNGAFGFFSLAMNEELKQVGGVRSVATRATLEYPLMPRLTDLTSPGTTVFQSDAAFSPTLERFSSAPDRNGTTPAGGSGTFAQRHSYRGANLGFLDGHAGFFMRRYITNGPTAREEKPNPDVVWNPNRGQR